MTQEHRTTILLRHYGNPIEYKLGDDWIAWNWESLETYEKIHLHPNRFRLPVYSLEDIMDEDLYAIGKILLHEDSWDGFAEGVFVHCAKGWIKEYQKAERAIRGGMVSMPLDLAVIDFLRSRQYATSHTVVIPKPEKEDFVISDYNDLDWDEVSTIPRSDKKLIHYNKKAYEQALKEWQPTKTFPVDELVKEGVYNLN